MALTQVFDGTTAPSFVVEIANVDLGTDADSTPGAWQEIEADVSILSLRRGRSQELDPIQPGSATIVVDNASGDYDPTNTTGRFSSGGATTLLPMRQVRITATWNNNTYHLFRGYTYSFTPDYSSAPFTTIECLDAITIFARAFVDPIVAQYDGDTTGVRIGRILDAIGWPTTLRSIDNGLQTMPSTTLGDTAQNLIQQAVTAEAGQFFIDGNGVATFLNRHAVFSRPTSVNVQAAFTDNGSGLDFDSLTATYSAEQVFNVIRVTRNGGVQQTAQDATSKDTYGPRDYPVDSLMVRTDSDALSYATFLLSKWKDPDFRITQVESEVVVQPTTGWPDLLPLDLGYRISVHRDYANNGGFTKELSIEGLSIDVTADPASFKVTLSTSTANRQNAIVLDSGPPLDTGTLAF